MLSRRKTNAAENIFINSEPSLMPKQLLSGTRNEFEETLRKVRFFIGKKNDPNELNVDQAVCVRDLTNILIDKENSSVVPTFVNGFEDHLQDEVRLKWSLMPTITSASCKTARNACQDSLAHILLGIEIIQEEVSRILLDKVLNEYTASPTDMFAAEGKSVTSMIISQYRWLNKLVDSKKLADKLLEVIDATPTEIQKDIIILLPDVINEFDHPKVAKHLSVTSQQNPDLNITILSTLSNLNIESETLKEIRKRVLNSVSSANIEDLPVIVKFVLLNLADSEAIETIRNLRNNLDFTTTFNPIISSTPIQQANFNVTQGVGDLVLNTIKLSLKFQKSLCDAWIKFIEQLKTVPNHKSIDIMVLLMLLSLGMNAKKIESLIRNKIKCGDINEDLLHVTFRCHNQMLKEYSPILLKLAEILLCSYETIISSFGCALYSKSFHYFDTYNKQEVIGNLVTHVGNNSENEKNAALDTLLSLVRNQTHKMVPFGLFLKNLLDHLNDLALGQIKKVYAMLGILSFQGGREGAMLQDDLFIVIRKQLTNGNLRYKKMGVIGALMAAKTSCIPEVESESIVSEPNSEGDQVSKCSIALLELICESISDSVEAYALFCDELSQIINEDKLHKQIQDWLDSNVIADFEDLFIVEIKSDDEFGEGVGPKFALDDVEEPVAIDLYNIAKNDMEKSTKKSSNLKDTLTQASQRNNKFSQNPEKLLNKLLKLSSAPSTSNVGDSEKALSSPLKLAPLFRLLKTHRLVNDANLDSIDALLGCPIILPELKNLKFFMLPWQKKHLYLNLIFYFINWVRENINAFSVVKDEQIKINICMRLILLVDLEELACKFIVEAKDFVPPPANFDCEEHDISHLKFPTQKSVKRKKSKKTKSKKAKVDTTQPTLEISLGHVVQVSNSHVESETEDVIQEASNTVTDTSLLNILQPYFRELDLEVFSAFDWDLTFNKRPDVFTSERITKVTLHPKDLHFLLEDLAAKLHHLFFSSRNRFKATQKRIGFSNLESRTTQKVVTFCVDLLPSLCKLAEKCCNYFQTLRKENDSILDTLAMIGDDSQMIAKCMQQIFKIIGNIFSWNGFGLVGNSDLLKTALKMISSKSKKLPDRVSISELVNQTVVYFMNYADDMPSVMCAATLVQLLTSPLQYTNENKPGSHVSAVALEFLKKKWVELDKIKASEINVNIEILLEAYISNSKPVLKSLDYLAVDAIPHFIEQQEQETDEIDMAFSTIRKSSLHCYYKIMLKNLATYMKLYYAKKPQDVDEELNNWSIAIKVFQVLTNVIKTFEGRVMIGACLKYGRQLVDTFLKHGMPLMDMLFKSKREEVVRLVKTLQLSTRYMQHICCHSKVLKDMSLTRQVPFLKKSLEVLVYRVKMMLVMNNCQKAFWVGNLKNRDLRGAEIPSQETPDIDINSSESDDEQDADLSDQSNGSYED